jgi:hypothetical protein
MKVLAAALKCVSPSCVLPIVTVVLGFGSHVEREIMIGNHDCRLLRLCATMRRRA